MATIKDVATLADVSTATVSRVLNGHQYVKEETRQRVWLAIEELNYKPSRVARGLRKQSNQIISVLISDIANPFFTSVLKGIEDVAHTNNYVLLLCNSNENPSKEELYLDVLRSERVAGIIISPVDEECPNLKPLIEDNVPIVAMDRRLSRYSVDTVIVENIEGANLATDYLIQLGHRRIGLITGPQHVMTGRERFEGYQKAFRDNGISIDENLIKLGDYKQATGYEKACELLESDNPPSAIFSVNNLMTLGVLNAIHDKNLNIPQDVSVLGFDDMPWAISLNPPLTVVSQPAYELGSTAADLLLQRISKSDQEIQEVLLETSLIVRDSCGNWEA